MTIPQKTPVLIWLPPILAVALVAAIVYFSQSQQRDTKPHKYHKQFTGIMGTQATIVIYQQGNSGADQESAAQIVQAAFDAAKKVEGLMNAYDPKSDISRINASSKDSPVNVHPLTWQVLCQSLRFNYLSDGAFNPLTGRLIKLYKWKNNQQKSLPPHDKIEPAVKSARIENLMMTRQNMQVASKNGALLDLGGIAKGFGVDAAIAELKSYGVKNAMVEIGGEIRIIGDVPLDNGVTDKLGEKHRPWTAGIRNPRGLGWIESLKLDDGCAIATSGDYEKFFEIDGKRYSHIIHPDTGLPVSGGVISATIISPTSCLEADALATSACVMGLDNFKKVLNLFADLRAILIMEDGTTVRLKSTLSTKPASTEKEAE